MKKNYVIWFRSVVVALVSFILVTVLYFGKVFNIFENKTYDQRMIETSKYIHPNSDISLISVDQASIDWAKEEYGWGWPWPREAYGRMIEFVSAGNAKSIAFDIIYSDPSIYGEEDDITLGRYEKDSGIVIQTVYVYEEEDKENLVLYPVDHIKNNAAMLGNITSAMDDDDIIRRGRLYYDIDGDRYPTLGTAPLYLNEETEYLENLPVLKDGTVLLRYQQNLNKYNPYRACDILSSYDIWKSNDTSVEPVFVPEDFEDGYVYVAYYAAGLFDICSTPVSQVFPGVGVHITTLDNCLSGNFIRKVPEIIICLWNIIVAIVGALVVAFASTRRNQKQTVLFLSLGIFIGGGIIIGLPWLLFIAGIWFKLVAPAFSFILSFIITLGMTLTIEGKQKRFIKSAFSQCLAAEVVNRIIDDPDSFKLGGEYYNMTAIFTDIEKFSTLSSLLTPQQLGKLINVYLTKMSDIIMEEGGLIDKYEGDAIIAMVGAPVSWEDHAARACIAAIRIKEEEKVLNESIAEIAKNPKASDMDQDLYDAYKILKDNNKRIYTRIGINSGEMIAGYFGATLKKNYTMMGDNVNLASRLEGVNKQYHTYGILISESTKEGAGDRVIVRKLNKVRVINVPEPVRLYELMGSRDRGDEALVDYVADWDCAMEAFESKDYETCLKQMKLLKNRRADDSVADYFIYLLENYFILGKFPTETDLEGVVFEPENCVFVLQQK